MNWLFWKEYRQNRVIVIALLVMLVVPYLFLLYFMADRWYWGQLHGFSWRQIVDDWRVALAVASIYSFGISQVALALIGGNVIAGERADRSAEFQVYLPLTRAKILKAKLLLVLAIAAAIWLIDPLVAWTAPVPTPDWSDFRTIILNAAVTGLVFFCVAWFFSTILRSPTFSVAAGLMTPVIIISLIAFGEYLVYHAQGKRAGPRDESIIQTWYAVVSLAVALPSFSFGTWLYLRRVEP